MLLSRFTRLPITHFLDFSKGYRKYELQTAMNFNSIYAMRFYELFSGQKDPITYSIPYLKERFKIENKYNSKNGKKDFLTKVVDVAQKELDEKVHILSVTKLREVLKIFFYPDLSETECRCRTGKESHSETNFPWLGTYC